MENDRRRTAQALSVRPRHVAFILQVSRYRPAPEFRWHSYDERELWRIQIATDNIVRGSFGCAKWNWTAESFSYSSPSIGQGISRRWQYLDSLCSAIIDLSTAGVPNYVKGCLQVLFSEVADIARTVERRCFIIQLIWIWKICLNLSKICLPLPRTTIPDGHTSISTNPLPPKLLCMLKQQLATKFGRYDPACQAMSGLLAIFVTAPEKLKSTLDCAYFMTIKAFENVIAVTHPMVLKMWSHYSRVCGQTIVFSIQQMGEVYAHMRTRVHGKDTPDTMMDLLSLVEMDAAKSSYQLGNFSKYGPMLAPADNGRLKYLEDFVATLREKAKYELEGGFGFNDGMAVEAFLYCTKLLALKLYVNFCRDYSLETLDEAIDLLRHGGTECLISASALSKERLKLLSSGEQRVKNQRERARLFELRNRLPNAKPAGPKKAKEVTKAENARWLRKRRQGAKLEMIEYLENMLDGVMRATL